MREGLPVAKAKVKPAAGSKPPGAKAFSTNRFRFITHEEAANIAANRTGHNHVGYDTAAHKHAEGA